MSPATLRLPTAADIAAAARRIAANVRRTPVLRAVVDGRPLVLKLEQLQLTGSFKVRGAMNALMSGPRPGLVITASGGNHGLGVAEAARILGMPARIHVPRDAPAGKVRRIRATGAEIVQHDGPYARSAEAARADADRPGTRLLHAYDESAVIAGQGTVGAEIVADAPDVDTVVVAVGGGGLAAGVALAIGARTLVAVEPENCDCLRRALEAGQPVDAPVESIAASALGASRVGALPFAVLGGGRTRSVLVADAQLVSAMDRLWEEFRLAVEPAAAAPFAAWLAGEVPGDLPCLVVCAANADWRPPT
jgi:threonine dehydratase